VALLFVFIGVWDVDFTSRLKVVGGSTVRRPRLRPAGDRPTVARWVRVWPRQGEIFFLLLRWKRDRAHDPSTNNNKTGTTMHSPLSSIDRKILLLLQHNADLSAAEVAEKVELSQSPCWRRINRMQEEGLIERKVALLNPKKLGLNMTVFVNIKLSAHGRSNLDEFERAVVGYSEVLECHTMAGESDYLLKVVAKDIDSYERFLRDQLLQRPHVQEAHSHIAMSEVKRTTELPLD
jgi:Lrp/AsnC family transcriptional regulator